MSAANLRWLLPLVVLGSLGWSAPALATTVGFDFTDMQAEYTKDDNGTSTLYVHETEFSLAKFDTREDGVLLDRAWIEGADSFDSDLSLVVTGGSGDYSLDGTFTVTDLDGNRVEALFQSTSIEIIGGTLLVAGSLSPLSGTSVLVGGDPWVYTGSATDTPDSPDADGVDGTITVSGAGLFGTGVLFQIPDRLGHQLARRLLRRRLPLDRGRKREGKHPARPGAELARAAGGGRARVPRDEEWKKEGRPGVARSVRAVRRVGV